MYLISVLALFWSVACAHYVYPGLIHSGQRTTEWTHTRWTIDRFNKAPVTSVTGDAIRCNEDPKRPVALTLPVQAGEVVGFYMDSGISHPGPLMIYLAKVPAGETAASWNGTGSVWFKVYEVGATAGQWGQVSWPALGVSTPSVTLPKSLPSGEYLIRVEQIAMHGAYKEGGAQFYIGCGQLNVSGGGAGTPGPLVAFPGAYSPTDPGILYDMYSNPKPYVIPGPTVWKG